MTDLSAARRLVKSPPELWAEISDPEALARHLGEFGEIRITKVEPEHTVAWEGDLASGIARIESSGWGTKVVLTAEIPEPEPERSNSRLKVGRRGRRAGGGRGAGSGGGRVGRAKAALADRESRLADAAATLSRAKAALAELGRPGRRALVRPSRQRRPSPSGASSTRVLRSPVRQPPRGGGGRASGQGRALGRDAAAGLELATSRRAKAEAERRAAEACRAAEAERSEAAARRAQAEGRVAEARGRVEAERTAAIERRAEADRRAREAARAAAEASPGRPGRERSQAALEKVLDDLGSAHHRPFSRA